APLWSLAGPQRWLAPELSQRYACLRSHPRGCQATCLPPGGSATRSNGRCALPHLSALRGDTAVGTGAAALCPCGGVHVPRRPGLLGLHLSLCGLSSLLAWLRNVMPQGSYVKARPHCAHQQDGHRGLAANEGNRACQTDIG